MNFNIIRSLVEFERLSGEWNELLYHGASHVPFLRHEYLTTWWQTLGGGEWKQGELCIVIGRSDNGSLAGIAPLFYTKNKEGKHALLFLGSIEISDFLDFIVPPDNLPLFFDSLFDYLDNSEAAPWQVLDLYNLLDSSPSLPALKNAAEKRGWSYQQECLQHSPYIPLPRDWDSYLARIDKKQRHEIRRKIRRFESAEFNWQWYITKDASDLDRDIEAFFDLMAKDTAKNSFLTNAMRSQIRQSIMVAFVAGWLQLAFLEIMGEKAAAYLNFDYDNHIWVYNSGMDFRFREYSPGWVLLGYLLMWAIEHGRKCFDFMRGDEDYKYRFGGVDRFVVRAQVER